MTVSESQLRERLRTVEDPALGIDIVSLGLVTDIRIADGVANITLAFNAPMRPTRWRWAIESVRSLPTSASRPDCR